MATTDATNRKLRNLEQTEQQRLEELKNLENQIQQLRDKYLSTRQEYFNVRFAKEQINELVQENDSTPSTSNTSAQPPSQ